MTNSKDSLSNGVNAPRSIGLFDSGLGGLTVLRELRATLPQQSFIYLGDTARTPYGTKGAPTIARYARECTEFLLARNIGLLVVACNTVSSIALEELTEFCPCPVIGTIEPAVQAAVRSTQSGRVGVIGTRATIASGAYEKRLKELRPEIEVFSQACPLLVPLVEEGITSGPVVNEVLKLYLESLREKEIDTLILGCTHYPLLVETIQSFLGDSVTLVECSKEIALIVKAILSDPTNSQMLSMRSDASTRTEQYFVTDDVARFNSLGQLFSNDPKLTAVRVDELIPDSRMC